ncbi:trypsin-like peptidase domain-containing protein [Streptomyces ferrugineus]|uniref:Trypsin-like peptidase domain-containing protein n=1 Tax=Streptomyces ferrugineus TaxID=1413221 RepID=A0A7M2ST09_9ACTN|nr:trypsin-like peptidase domain-containing protein [Streptomyces ferrugineus]QOV38411.1 trypsin-like peptidase domain-containing protein [Streptomyces ferrugineus]
MTRSAEGLDVTRAVEVIAEPAEGPGRRGSGYRVTGGTVLTAAHVVAAASAVRVRCNADTAEEWTRDAHVIGTDGDLALLAVDRSDELAPVRYGRVPERDAVIACTGLGFPRFKLRDDASGSYRDLCHLLGSAPVLSNRRSGTLEITVASPPEPDPDPARSAWEGMSGAPVFAAGRLIAVVTANHALEGAGRLAAHRIDTLYGDGDATLRAALGLPARAEDLPDVLPPVPRSLVLEAHQAEVASIAPLHMVGRDAELAELTEFCSGPDPYLWWQAGPWAGKTALASSFAAAPPDGVRVVSFFVTARLAGQADATALSASLIRQLAEIAERPLSPGAGGPGLLTLLLTEAAERCARRGERLVLVVDGLDEDQGARPSVAALLPRRPPDNLRVLVTSRHHPGLPDDVPGDHPLRTCRIRHLEPSAYAQDLGFRARAELQDLIRSGPDGYEVVALITASGGGLTPADLAVLTRRRHHEVAWHIDSVFGRAFTSRTTGDEQVLLFAHETLRATAEQLLGPELTECHDRLHDWARQYRDRGWPDDTPRYLLEPYARLLAAREDTDRLAELALDRRRHERMLARFGTDRAALAEIAAAAELLADVEDLTRPTLLVLERRRLDERSYEVPRELAAVWARLGYFGHAAELSEFLYEDPLADYALALVEAGQYEDAAEAVRRRPDYELLVVWAALLRRAVTEDPDQVAAWTADALATMEAMPSFGLTLDLFADLLDVLSPYPAHSAMILEKARALTEDLEPAWSESALDRLLFTLAAAPDDADRALRAVEEARRAFDALAESRRAHYSGVLVCGLLRAAVVVGPTWTAEQVGAEIDAVMEGSRSGRPTYWRPRGLSVLAETDPSRAARWARECLADFLAREAEEPTTVDDWEYDPDLIHGWRQLLDVLVRTGRHEDVRELLLRHRGLLLQPRLEACCALVRHGPEDDGEKRLLLLRGAGEARRSEYGPHLLARLAAAASVTADRALAVELATEAEQAAREHPSYDTWQVTRTDLARALMRLGRLDEAEEVYRAGGVPASLRADLALAHSRTSPGATLRLLDGIDDRARWQDTDGRSLEKITNADLAKASAALEDLHPDRAAALLERAVTRAQGRANADKRWQGLIDVVAFAAPKRAERVLADLAEELRTAEDWPPMRRYGLARALLPLDPGRAARLLGRVSHAHREEFRSVDRVAVLAVTEPALAAEAAERMLEDDSISWLMDELAEALLGDPRCPGDPALRPLARRCARAALAGTHWAEALPPLAELEPEAVLAVHERLRELGALEPR